jgi:Fe(3+) dicitrate transport protein
MGIGSEFLVTKNTQLYSNYSQGYRPTTFSELTPSATNEIIDPNLKDASGFNFDFGYKGTIKKFLNFDVNVFYLLYDNRIGTIKKDGAPFRTNIGTSVSKGVESFIEIDLIKIFTDKSRFGNISIFASNAFIDAKYTKWNNPEIINDPSKSIQNKRVENAPEYIHRFGITYYHSWISITLLYNKVGDVYTDAANTELPNNSATIGKINSYQLMDLSMKILLSKQYSFKVGINNLKDEKYATRRAGGYPGPGLIPGNGRTFYFTLGVNI